MAGRENWRVTGMSPMPLGEAWSLEEVNRDSRERIII
jgi:hypothetical protein